MILPLPLQPPKINMAAANHEGLVQMRFPFHLKGCWFQNVVPRFSSGTFLSTTTQLQHKFISAKRGVPFLVEVGDVFLNGTHRRNPHAPATDGRYFNKLFSWKCQPILFLPQSWFSGKMGPFKMSFFSTEIIFQ